MSTYTKNLKLFKYDPEVDGKEVFSIQKALNANWDILDARGGGSFLLDCKWTDHIVSDISWLRADTFSWQDGNVYKTVYDLLVEEYNTGSNETEGSVVFKRSTNGFKITDSSQEQAILDKYNTDGIAWYYILDTDNKRFKLPRAKHPSLISLNSTAPVKGNGLTLGLTNGSQFAGLEVYQGSSSKLMFANESFYGNKVSTASANGSLLGTFGVTSDGSKSGIIADLSNASKSFEYPMILYFYVGEYTREAIEQTAGLNSDLFNGKADINLANCNNTISTAIDGQWTRVVQTICSGVSGDSSFSTAYSIAEYLPDDGYNYEVLITGGGRTGTSSGNSIQMWVSGGLTGSVLLTLGITRTSNYMPYAGNAIIPVSNARNISLACTNSVGTNTAMYLQLRGYRRIGTNN